MTRDPQQTKAYQLVLNKQEEEHTTTQTPLTILRHLCDLLTSTAGLVSANLELAMPQQGTNRDEKLRYALMLSNRALWAVKSMDAMISNLESEALRESRAMPDALLKRLKTQPDSAEGDTAGCS